MKTAKDTKQPFTVAATKEISDLVEKEALKEDRPKSRMAAKLIAEALVYRQNSESNITPYQAVNHG